MNIISEKEDVNRIVDGINTILSLTEEEFRFFIEKMMPSIVNMEPLSFYYPADKCCFPTRPIQIGIEKYLDANNRYICRAYCGHDDIPIFKIIKECQKMLDKYPVDSKEYARIKEFIHCRDLESFKKYYSEKEKVDQKLLDMLFQIISNDNILTRFFDYDNNRDFFDIKDIKIGKSEYLRYLGWIFGSKDRDGTLKDTSIMAMNFFIPNYQEMKNRYLQIYDRINMERYVNPWYTFSISLPTSRIVREDDEPDWKVSSEIKEEIYRDMPEDLSLEEKATYIYCKMCLIFLFDEGYMYRDKIEKINYDSTFSKEHLENLKPGDKITCFDFARVYAKMINEIKGDITAVIILEGKNEGHASTGFYTENVSATVEAINVSADNSDRTNDLMKAKNGIRLKGIKTISDKNGILKQAIDKVLPMIFGKEPKTIAEYVQQLKNYKEENVPNNLELKLQSLIEIMKLNHICGNEFVQTLLLIGNTNYFGDTKIELLCLGKLQKEETGGKRYKRFILLMQPKKEDDSNQSENMYLIDTDTLNFIKCSEKEIVERINSGELVYESEEYKLHGTDEGDRK